MVITLKTIIRRRMESFPNPLDFLMYLYRQSKQKVALKGILNFEGHTEVTDQIW